MRSEARAIDSALCTSRYYSTTTSLFLSIIHEARLGLGWVFPFSTHSLRRSLMRSSGIGAVVEIKCARHTMTRCSLNLWDYESDKRRKERIQLGRLVYYSPRTGGISFRYSWLQLLLWGRNLHINKRHSNRVATTTTTLQGQQFCATACASKKRGKGEPTHLCQFPPPSSSTIKEVLRVSV